MWPISFLVVVISAYNLFLWGRVFVDMVDVKLVIELDASDSVRFTHGWQCALLANSRHQHLTYFREFSLKVPTRFTRDQIEVRV
jgi:hypothetical protein